MLIDTEPEEVYGDATTAAEEKFEREREEAMRLLSPLSLMWARNRLEQDINELEFMTNLYMSEETMARNYLSIALHFQFNDLAEHIKAKFKL